MFAKNSKIVDSLQHVFKTAKYDTTKVRTLFDLATEVYLKNPDTAYIICEKALLISQKINFKEGEAESYNWLAYLLQQSGEIEKAIVFNQKSLALKIELGNKEGVADSYNNLGFIFYKQGEVENALKHFHESIKIYESLNDKQDLANSLNNLAYIYKAQGEIENALEYYMKSLKYRQEINDRKGISESYINIGAIHLSLGNNKDAIQFYHKSISIKEEINDLKGLSNCYNNLGAVYKKMNDFERALDYYYRSIKMYEQIGNKNGLCYAYNNIADIMLIKKNQNLASEYYSKSLQLATELGYLDNIKNASKGLSDVYIQKGDYKNAWINFNLFINTKDSIHNVENEKAVIKQKMQYEYEKKQLADSITHAKELEIKEIENKRQQVLIYAFIFGFLIVLIFSVLLYRMFVQKKKANIQLEFQNNEISQKNEEISAQRDEIEAQRDKVVEQKEEIEIIHSELSQSIDYAKKLQGTILPQPEILDKLFSDFFVLFKPKDKVSGDFYWWANVQDLTIVAAVDCTGHGVPGAFMSMLGISFLNEIVTKEMITNPAEILNKLRQQIIKSLQQKGLSGEQKDGMDMSLVCINHSTNTLQFSGANNPIYIVKSEKLKVKSEETLDELSTFNFQLQEVKPDKMPIAIYERMDSFSVQEFPIEKGDCVYMFSDGFADQFGGESGKKFKYQPFKKLLLEISKKAMTEQKSILNSTFENWKGNIEQVDDVVIVGIKI